MTDRMQARLECVVNGQANERSDQLREDEARSTGGRNARKTVAEHPAEHRRRLAKEVDAVNQYAAPT